MVGVILAESISFPLELDWIRRQTARNAFWHHEHY